MLVTCHTLTPIFNNHGLLIGGRPISCSTWCNSNVGTIDDLYRDTGLRTFQDIRNRYNLTANSFFFYLQLRSSLQAHGSPGLHPLPIHPLYKLLTTQIRKRGTVSALYRFFLEASYTELPLDRIWRYDCPNLDSDFDWSQVWANIREASRNPDRQQIHFNYVHRAYLTPRKLVFYEGLWHFFAYDVELSSSLTVLD